MSEIFAGNLHIYYPGVWIQRAVSETKKDMVFAFQSGCIKPQDTELTQPRHTNHFQVDSQSYLSVYFQESK